MNNSILQLRRNLRQQHSRTVARIFGSRTERHDEANRIAAQLILGDPERFGGKDAGLVRWGRMTMAQVSDEQRVPVPDVREGRTHEGGGS